MTKLQLISAIHQLRRPGDALIPGTKPEMERRLSELTQRAERDSKASGTHAAAGKEPKC